MFQNDLLYQLYADKYLYQWENLFKITVTIVDDKIDSFNIDTSSKEISCNQQSRSVCFEEIIVFDSFLLFELGVDADGIEQFLPEQLCEFFSAIDPVDEDDHLVEG